MDLHHRFAAEILAVLAWTSAFVPMIPVIVGVVGGLLAVVWYSICIWDRLHEDRAATEAAAIIAKAKVEASRVIAQATVAQRRADEVDSNS